MKPTVTMILNFIAAYGNEVLVIWTEGYFKKFG